MKNETSVALLSDTVTDSELERLYNIASGSIDGSEVIDASDHARAADDGMPEGNIVTRRAHLGPLTPRAIVDAMHTEQNAVEALTSKAVVTGIRYIIASDLQHGFNLRVLGEWSIRSLALVTEEKDEVTKAVVGHGQAFEDILCALAQQPLPPTFTEFRPDPKAPEGEKLSFTGTYSPKDRLAHALYGNDAYEAKSNNRQSLAVRRLDNALAAYKVVAKEAEKIREAIAADVRNAQNADVQLERTPEEVEAENAAKRAEVAIDAAKKGAPKSAKEAFCRIYNSDAMRAYTDEVKDGVTVHTPDYKRTQSNRQAFAELFTGAGFPSTLVQDWVSYAVKKRMGGF